MKGINLTEVKKDLMNPRAIIPNLLSTSRIAAPFVIPPLAISGNIPLVLLATSGFLLTDFLDGKIARALNGQTKLGQLLDQISDKICSIGLLLALIPTVPLMAIPLILESTIAAINIKSTRNGLDVKSVQSGRVKMWPLSISLISGYGMLLSPSIIFNVLTHLGIITTITLETINIKEYHDISNKCNHEEPEQPNLKEPIINTSNHVMSKEKTDNKINWQKVNQYIDSCTNIDDLTKIKEILDLSPKEEIKAKTKQR